jgi:glucokinase
MNLPIAFPNKKQSPTTQTVMTIDVGATKTHLAFFRFQKDQLTLLREAVFSSKTFDSFTDILDAFAWDNPKPEVMTIAFAGPIIGNSAQATNLDWHIDLDELKAKLQFDSIFLINDLEAHAYGLYHLEEGERQTIHIGNPLVKGNAAIIAPGTGLGEAGLFWDGKALHPFATEGGHAGFSPRDDMDDRILVQLRQQYGHVSWERLLSGAGISHIYDFLLQESGGEPALWIQEQSKEKNMAELVSYGAQKGDPVCQKTMALFFKYLAIECGNLALKFNATGGIFIGGGIVPKNLSLLDLVTFQKHFYDKGRLRPLLEQVPVYVVLNQKTALLGAAYYGAYASVSNPELEKV